ncbi:alpha/beta hydrolase [Ilumatobacter sp.]|uniref:alpha/beta hydrolase n=1 Tax=Ilumatobacter sp. TaxID=1967498 RepID=UPI0037521689
MARTVALGALVSITLIAAACTSVGGEVSTERSEVNTGTDDSIGTVGGSIVAPLAWEPCEDAGNAAVELDCARLVVPLDYAVPDGEQIEIAVARSAAIGAANDRIGSLVFNPGGPGGSGIESLGFIPLTMSSDILERFDLVSFDPRGVGASTALDCATDLDDEVALLAGGDDAGWAALLADGETQLESCDAATLDLAPFVGTNNAARDMDRLRVALGDDGLTYVGYSYGTRLGATYAELFPNNVRALVLDAGVKPTSDSGELDKEQGVGFDRALENFAAACDADSDCLLNDVGPTLDVIAGLEAEIAELGSFPTDDPDRVLTPGELSLGIAAALYSKESWPFLASALFAAEAEQDGTLLQVLGDSLVGRQLDGTYDNSNVANGFINCADDPGRPTADDQRAAADAAADLSTYFADFLRASTGCIGITPAVDPLVIGPAAGAAPIVVIGNSGDPATPYEWSVELANSLDSAVLYTVEAEGHTAYGSVDCVQAEIDDYIIELVVPAEGASCSDNASADFFVPEQESDIGQILAFFDCARDEGAEIPDLSEADVLADPTLDTVFGDIDLTDPSLQEAFLACSALLPEL